MFMNKKTLKITIYIALLFSCGLVFVIYNEKLYKHDTKAQDNDYEEKSIISNIVSDDIINDDVILENNDKESNNTESKSNNKTEITNNKKENNKSNTNNSEKNNNNVKDNSNDENNAKNGNNNEEQPSLLEEEKENNEANQQVIQQEVNNNDNSVDTNNLDYNIHRGRIDCSDLDDCMSKSLPIQYQFKKSILNSFYIEVIAKNDETLGYFIEYIFKEHNYGSKDECESVGNNIKKTLPSKVKGYECSNDGNLKIITDY